MQHVGNQYFHTKYILLLKTRVIGWHWKFSMSHKFWDPVKLKRICFVGSLCSKGFSPKYILNKIISKEKYCPFCIVCWVWNHGRIKHNIFIVNLTHFWRNNCMFLLVKSNCSQSTLKISLCQQQYFQT